MKKRFAIAIALLALALFALPRPLLAAPQPKPKPQGFRDEFTMNLDDVQDKIMALAESTPPEKYAWRPASDVRSISEVYMHIAGGNYFLSTFIGVPAPKFAGGDIEKTVTAKAEVIAELRKSFDHLRKAVNKVKDFEKPVNLFGKPTTQRAVLVTMLSHLHEHLGQSIAYARMNGVVPPWSR